MQRNDSIQDWITYKRFAAKLRIVIKAEKRRFWDTVYKDAGDPRLLHRVFRKYEHESKMFLILISVSRVLEDSFSTR